MLAPGCRRCALFFALLWGAVGPALAVQVRQLNLSGEAAATRAEVVLDGPAQYRSFALSGPDRWVIDIEDGRLSEGFRTPAGAGVVGGVRTGRPTPERLRLVFDLNGSQAPRVRMDRNGSSPRLVLEWGQPVAAATTPSVAPAQPAPAPVPVPAVEPPAADPIAAIAAAQTPPLPAGATRSVQTMFAGSARELVVAIDAGHGGRDPGAIGPTGVREKDVTLRVARELARQIDADPGMRAVLIRDSDTFVPLQERYMRARNAQADLFISVHADAAENHSAAGASVYVLSLRGASSQAARWLADKENAADLVGGIDLAERDRTVAAVLLDLSQTATLRVSEDMAAQVLDELKRVGRAHKHQVERANFVVLRSPDVPSMLVETGFITNPAEEQRLNDPEYRERLATAITTGVRNYFAAQPPPGTWYAAQLQAGPVLLAAADAQSPREHVVARGESLSLIAARHGVSVSSLREANRRRGDVVRIGERLTIPAPPR